MASRSTAYHRVSAAIVCAAMLFAAGCASSRRWGALAVDDVRAAGRAVRDADAGDWRRAGLVAGAVAAAAALDEPARDLVQDNRGRRSDRLAANVEPFGGRYSDRVLAGFFLAGVARNDSRAKAVAFDGLVSSLLASKVITPALKQISGRSRPSDGEGAYAFTLGAGSSFPSNHATQAFAVASVIASHYEQRWVDVTAYGVAALVGYARMAHDAHYLSDVVAGAVIGTTIGKLVVRTNERSRAKWTIAPARGGVVVTVRYER